VSKRCQKQAPEGNAAHARNTLTVFDFSHKAASILAMTDVDSQK
jgi:hypothetical protein